MRAWLSFLIIMIVVTARAGSDPVLTISNHDQTKIYTLNELMKRNDLEKVLVERDPAYQNTSRVYQAIKVSSLFEGMNIDDHAIIEFETSDGFSAPIAMARLLNQSNDQSIAYVALELPNKSPTGPFYLIWKNPALSNIGQEEWPFMLVGFTVKGTLESTYPAILPDIKLSKTDPVYLGFQVFAKQCFACHTMNYAGASHIGPDLNVPMNPTEYFQDNALRKLIRDPKKVRVWPNQQMTGFSEAQISNQELDNLIAYLKHMSLSAPRD